MHIQIFDRIDPANLDRRELQLLVLASTLIFILTVGIALLMYPSVFSTPVVVSGHAQRKVFFGFCTLGLLMLGYLIERQLMITYLRKQLVKERETLTSVRHEASADLLGSLPGFNHFQDRLAMEYRRAATTQQPLSLVMVVLKHVQTLSDPMEVAAAFSDAAKTLMHKLRGEDSIYLFGTGIFCIVLPGVTATNADHIADRLTDGLRGVLGGSARFSFRIQAVNYPEHAKSARELEEAVRPFAPRRFGEAVGEADTVRTTD